MPPCWRGIPQRWTPSSTVSWSLRAVHNSIACDECMWLKPLGNLAVIGSHVCAPADAGPALPPLQKWHLSLAGTPPHGAEAAASPPSADGARQAQARMLTSCCQPTHFQTQACYESVRAKALQRLTLSQHLGHAVWPLVWCANGHR